MNPTETSGTERRGPQDVLSRHKDRAKGVIRSRGQQQPQGGQVARFDAARQASQSIQFPAGGQGATSVQAPGTGVPRGRNPRERAMIESARLARAARKPDNR